MLRERVINFLETALVLLTLTNALSIAAAAYAISTARGGIPPKSSTAKSSSRCSFFFGTVCGRKPKAMELGHERHIGFVCLERPSCNASAVLRHQPGPLALAQADAMAVRPVSA